LQAAIWFRKARSLLKYASTVKMYWAVQVRAKRLWTVYKHVKGITAEKFSRSLDRKEHITAKQCVKDA